MYIPRLNSSCKYYFIGEMIYRWTAPTDMEQGPIFRLKLTTDVPPTSHPSGKLRPSYADAEASSMRMVPLNVAGLSVVNVAGVGLLAIQSLVLVCWLALRLRRKSRRIVLE